LPFDNPNTSEPQAKRSAGTVASPSCVGNFAATCRDAMHRVSTANRRMIDNPVNLANTANPVKNLLCRRGDAMHRVSTIPRLCRRPYSLFIIRYSLFFYTFVFIFI
jgi:hypothetical protein